ncbi:MAG: translation initiation factor IF-2 [Planctomycetaceae bacterium]|nr:translation initiation factor IF-2 [Planctomycetaceae bacterium]
MALRIYSLAKELNLDSKELVDICPKAGVMGKGSALASLSDDEVAKIKAFLSGGGSKPAAPVRPAMTPVTPTAAPKGAPTQPPVFRREDYIAPAGAAGRPPSLPDRTERKPLEPKRKSPDDAGRKPPPGPAIRLAALPPSQQPSAAPQANEPPAQKPDIRLPADAIRASKMGAKPLSEHLRKHEQRRKAETDEKAAPPAKGATPSRLPANSPLGEGARDRGRRGKVGEGDAAAQPGFDSSLGGREQRQLKRKRVTSPRKRGGDEDDGPARGTRRIRRTGTNTAAPRKSNVVLQLPCTVRSFSEAIGIPSRQVQAKLLALGTMSNINSSISPELCELLAIELGVEVTFKAEANLEAEVLSSFEEAADDPTQMVPRPPVVTFLGHVDHGKTSLLDRIIGTEVARGESGGITQHIRAYRIDKEGRPLAFVDTPGHEAFTAMRARGANVTDIAVLVVAADDGVMPQTEEAISHARAAGVPIVVALNKIDLPGVNVDRIYQQLTTNELQPRAWGGDVEVIHTSATTGVGIDDLLETLLLLAELQELKANPTGPAMGTCLEAEMHEGRGVVAKMLVQKGTLRVGDVVVCGSAYGRVKAMHDTLIAHKKYDEAGPSTPVNLTGLNVAPGAGDHFYVLSDIAQAREIAESREAKDRQAGLVREEQHVTLENLFEHLGKREVQTLNLILRADVRGSIEAIKKEFTKLSHPEVQIRILQASVGGVSEADVQLANASDAVIIAFNVVPDEGARSLAENLGVQVRRYDIIYQVTDDLRKALEGMLKPIEREVELGRALVQRLFVISRIGTIAGCRVLAGTIERNARARLIRENRVLGDYALESLRREKDDAREVREGFECGIKLAGFNDLKEGDIIEAYKMEEVARTL